MQKYIAILLLLIFSAFSTGQIFCIHTHNSDDGIIVHSHPFIPSSQHTHTSAQFVSIATINSTSYDDSGCSAYFNFSLHIVSSIILQANNGFSTLDNDVAVKSLRAPPFLV